MSEHTATTPEDHATDPADESLTSVIAGRRECGEDCGDGQFQAAGEGDILCLTCRQRFASDTQQADDVDRLEGASDPADMSMVLAVRCPHCSTSGTLVLRYGPEASAEEADLLVGLRRHRPAEPGRPPSA